MSGQSLESGTRRSVDVAALAATPTERAERRSYCITERRGARARGAEYGLQRNDARTHEVCQNLEEES